MNIKIKSTKLLNQVQDDNYNNLLTMKTLKVRIIMVLIALLLGSVGWFVGTMPVQAATPASVSGMVYGKLADGTLVPLPGVRLFRMDNWNYDYCPGNTALSRPNSCWGDQHGVEVETDGIGTYKMGNTDNNLGITCTSSGAHQCPAGPKGAIDFSSANSSPFPSCSDPSLSGVVKNWCGFNCGSNPHWFEAYFPAGYSLPGSLASMGYDVTRGSWEGTGANWVVDHFEMGTGNDAGYPNVNFTFVFDTPLVSIGGKVTDPSGTGVAGVEIGVKNAAGNNDPAVDPGNWRRVFTDGSGNWSVDDFIAVDENYAVRILAVPAGYQAPYASNWNDLSATNGTPIGWTWIDGAGRDTTVGEPSYESQKARVNDCAGPAGIGGPMERCNFIAVPVTSAPIGTVTGPQVIGLHTDKSVNETSIGSTARFNYSVSDSDGNLDKVELYRRKTDGSGVWKLVGADTACSGSSCTGSFDWNLSGAGTNDGAGDYYLALNVYDTDGNQCSGNVLPDSCNPNDPFGPACTNLWGAGISGWYSCGAGNTDVVMVKVIEPPFLGTPALDAVSSEVNLTWSTIPTFVDDYMLELFNTTLGASNTYSYPGGVNQTTFPVNVGDDYNWEMWTSHTGTDGVTVESGRRQGSPFTLNSLLLVEPTVVPYTPTP